MTFYVLLHQSQIQLLLCHQKDWISPGFTRATLSTEKLYNIFKLNSNSSIPCLLLSALRCPSFTFLKSYVYCVMFAHTLMHACTTNVIWEDLFFGKKCRGALLLLRWSNPIFQYYHKQLYNIAIYTHTQECIYHVQTKIVSFMDKHCSTSVFFLADI